MKLKDLKDILKSRRSCIQWCIVYDYNMQKDVCVSCSVEYAIEHHGEREVRHICSCFENGRDQIVIEVN